MGHPRRNDEGMDVTRQNRVRVLTEDDAVKKLMQMRRQERRQAERAEALPTGEGERTVGRLGYRSGHDSRTRVTRVGKVERRVPH